MKYSEIVNFFLNLLPIAKSKIKESASQLEVTTINEYEEDLLPKKLIERLSQKLHSLPIHNEYREFLQKDLFFAIDNCLNNYNYQSKNCVVIKGNPVDYFGKIISQICQIKDIFCNNKFSYDYQILLTSDFSLTKEQRLILLQEKLENIKHKSPQTIVVIPELSYYFSRTVKGLEIIENLLNLINKNNQTLWIIGCNDWLWLFMSKIYNWDDYIQKVCNFPSLSAEDLQNLLEPVLNLVELNWDAMKKYLLELSSQQLDEETTINKIKAQYYDNLANLSQGCFAIANQVCFYSLRYHQKQEENRFSLIIKNPRFPSLPKITQSERYILFCLGLHHHLTKEDIALILGDNQVYLNTQIQSLINLNLIIFLDQYNLTLNPIYFYKIEKDLKNNHFLVST